MKLILISLLLIGCTTEAEDPPPVVASPSPAPPSRWEEITQITQTYCARCHDGAPFLQSESAFLTAKVKGRIDRREMPPLNSDESRQMNNATRQNLLNYFN